MELIIREELQQFLEKHNKLPELQLGFRSGKLCISQLLSHTEMIIVGMEARVNIDFIYLDFQKAFDKVDHNVIIRRCREKGIIGLLRKWITDYLQSRTQRVIANNEVSKDLIVVSGVS